MTVNVAERERPPGAEGFLAAQAECPPVDQLAAYGRGELPRAALAAVETHLCDCGPCFERVAERAALVPLAPQIPGYVIVGELGRGRFGVVYKAWTTAAPRRIVALKILTALGDMEASRFEREIAVLQRIESPGIVRCLESGTAAGSRYFVMEYVEGTHFDEYAARPELTLNDKLELLEHVCRAVADAHSRGVVHRDLKPRNILVEAQGRPRILDFGICSVHSEDWTSRALHTITQAGDVIGTLKYMSPEQAWGGVGGTIGPGTDLWALGIILHDIVTGGAYPYSLESTPDRPAPEALLERIRRELPRLPRLESLPRGRDLEVLLERCLAYEVSQRIPSAAALADDLGRYRRGERIVTRPPGIVERVRRLAVGAATRSRWPFTVALTAGTVAFVWLATAFFDVGWYVSPASGPNAAGRASAADAIAVVGVADTTTSAVIEYAQRSGLAGVTADATTWRGVHGRLMEKLAGARPLAVVWDYYFRSPRANDDELVKGILALEEVGTPVVLASLGYDERGRPDISPNLVESLGHRLRHGTITGRDMVRRPGEFVLAVGRNEGAAIPSLSLSTLAALLQPQARLDIEGMESRGHLSLLYEAQPGAYLRVRDRVELTKMFHSDLDHAPVRKGDRLACVTYPLRRPEFWEQRTVAYEALLNAEASEIPALVGGRILLFGDLRQSPVGARPDRHTVKVDGQTLANVPGVYLVADSLAGTLSGPFIRSARPLSPTTMVGLTLIAGAAVLAPIRLARHRFFASPAGRRAVCLGLAGAALAAFTVMAGSRNVVNVYAGMIGMSAAAPMIGAFWVEFARNRHWMLERSRAEAMALDGWAAGTITLAPRRSKSPSA